ncbi:MAG: metallophosphoesterase [Bacteroidota bacterium]
MRFFVVLLLLVFVSSCASYQEHYAKGTESLALTPAPEGKTLAYRTYLIGDAGNAAEGQQPPVLRHLTKELPGAPKQSSVVFLGDNIYPSGLPKKKDDEREFAEHRLKAQTKALKDYPGKVFFMPGNHDWYKYGIDGLRRQKDFLEDEIGRKKLWEPKVGCGGPEVVEIHDNLVYIIIDTQWWLENWSKHPEINEGCDATNRTDFIRLFKDAVKGNKEKHIVVLMHHPMETYGAHGGHFTFSDHFFPLRKIVNKNLWVPLPGLGSLMPFLRTNVGSKQDLINASFQELKTALLSHVQLNGNATFVSGHEHSLQYIEKDNQRYIVSGSASKISPVGLGEGSLFSYGGRGYSVLDLYEDGSLWVTFWTVDDEGRQPRVLFRKEIESATEDGPYTAADYTFENYPITEDSVVCQVIHDKDYTRKGLRLAILGEHYRNTFSSELTIPQLDLSSYLGGLTPIKKGGGNQTKSIRLEAKDGRQYTMRSLEKDPSATVGYQLSQSRLVRKVVEDAFTAAHPLSAMPVIGLAAAAGINHTNPDLYYIPKQPALGKYNVDYGDKTYLVEERPDDDLWSDQESFGNPDDIISTAKALRGMRKHHDYLLDVPAMARARAFDLLLGDWDRHDDQWRWVVDKRGKYHYHVPIPRDRDQAFSNYDGLLLGIARLLVPDTRPLAPFKEKPNSVKWMTHGNRFFDVTFLSEIDWPTWEKEAKHLQTEITDEVIERSFRQGWPPEIYAQDGEKVMSVLKKRRDNLVDIVRDLYEFRAREVEIAGTDKKDYFSLDVQDNGDVIIKLFDSDKKGNKEGDALYERRFLGKETKQIVIYGLDGDDSFVYSGPANRKIRLRLVGGTGEDNVRHVDGNGTAGKTLYYDFLENIEESELNDIKGLRDRRSADARYNTYSRLSLDKNYNNFSLLGLIGFNPDNGLFLGASTGLTHYGFKKDPFAGNHHLSGQFAFATSGSQLAYRGEFTDFFGKDELVLSADGWNSLYGVNFYGLGNETVNTEDENGVDFHRVRQQLLRFSPHYMRRLGPASSFSFGPTYTATKTDRTDGRFLAVNNDIPAGQGIFSDFKYLSLNAKLAFDNRNSAAMPTKGINFQAEAGYHFSLDSDKGSSFPAIRTALTLNQQLDKHGVFVVANRIGYSALFTDEFEYFQAVSLGGAGPMANLRGFRRERFSGKSAFFFNTDLRLRLLSSRNSNIPFSLGLLGGFDIGRVWLEEEDSDTWHSSLGGGLWISPFDLAVIKVSLFKGDSGKGRLLVGSSFFF